MDFSVALVLSLSLSFFFFPHLGFPLQVKKKNKTVTTRRKPYYFSFSCLESGQYLAAIIFWLCLELPCTSPQQSATWEVGMWGWTVWVCAWEVSCPLGCGPIPGVHWRHLLLVWGWSSLPFASFLTTGSLTRRQDSQGHIPLVDCLPSWCLKTDK